MRNEFALPKDLIYLNSGTMSYSPLSVQAALKKYSAEIESNPAQSFVLAFPRMWAAQKDLAQFLKARPQDLFLRTNVTYAMNDFLMALQIPQASEILISNLEYGAVANICRYKAEMEGHDLKIMNVPFDSKALKSLTVAGFLELFQKHLTKKTKLVMFSHVATGPGFVFPVEKIAEICRDRKIIFAVDGAHGAGSVPLDFSKTKVDFYGSNLHKWMMGPKGTGFGWVSPDVRPRLIPKFAGWTTYGQHPLFSSFGEGDPWTYRWMICSSVHFSQFLGIAETIQFWKATGAEAIMKAQRKLRDLAAEIVSRKTGWPCVSQTHEEFRGPMVAFEVPESLSRQGMELIPALNQKHNLQVAMTQIQERWYLRLAPHVYNLENEIERAAEILAGI